MNVYFCGNPLKILYILFSFFLFNLHMINISIMLSSDHKLARNSQTFYYPCVMEKYQPKSYTNQSSETRKFNSHFSFFTFVLPNIYLVHTNMSSSRNKMVRMICNKSTKHNSTLNISRVDE